MPPPIPPLPTEPRVGQLGVVAAAADLGTLYNDDDRSIEQKYGKLVAPRFEIEISDTNDVSLWSAESMVQGNAYDLNGIIINDVAFEEDIEGADVISITINDPDQSLQNSRLFTEGNNIDLWMGYDGRRAFYMGRGIIVEIEPELPPDGMASIKVKAYDKSYFMMEEGRAEIVPEGSEWWQRRAETSQQRTSLLEHETRSNRYNNQDPSEEQIAEDERFEAAFEAETGERNFIPDVGLDAARESGVDTTDRRRIIRQARVSSDTMAQLDDGDVAGHIAAMQPQTRMGWRRQNFGRRRRQAGKVWRGKTDSEIASAIFLSYRIDPYVEATHERTRVRGRAQPPGQPRGERTGRPSRGPVGYVVEDEIEGLHTINPLEEQARGGRSGEVALLDNPTVYDPYDYDAQGTGLLYSRPGDTQQIEGSRIEAALGGERARYTEIDGDAYSFMEAERLGMPLSEYLRVQNERFNEYAARIDPDEEGVEPGNYFMDEFDWENSRPIFSDLPTTPSTSASTRRPREVTQKAGTTDWDFITKLAKQHGFVTFVFFHIESRRWIGYWGPEGNIPQSTEWIFRRNAGDATTLGTIRPNISMRNQSTEIDLLYVDPVSGKTNRLRVAMENANPDMAPFSGIVQGSEEHQEPIGDGPEVVLTIHGQRVRTQANRRFANADDARRWLMAFWMEHAQDFMFIEGNTIVGLPEMRARERHQFAGSGRYSGRFFVSMSRHDMRPGQVYGTAFTARKVANFDQDDPGDDMVVLDQEDIGGPEVAVPETGVELPDVPVPNPTVPEG